MQREKAVQSQIVTLLRSLGAVVYVLGTRRKRGDFQGTMMTAGLPDLMVFMPVPHGRNGICIGRQLLMVEVKALGGRLRPEQARFRELCLAGGVAHVTGDLDAVIAWLTGHGYLKPENLAHYRQSVVPA